MAPKTISLIAAVALLSVTVTVSLAQTQCQQFSTLSKALENYDFPGALFPNDVQSFSCNPVSVPDIKDAISLVVRLKGGACTVKTREFMRRFQNVFRFEQQFSAIISYRQLTNVKGFTIGLIFQPFGPLNGWTKVDHAKIVQKFFTTCLQYNDNAGSADRLFPIDYLPSKPPSCDSKTTSGAIIAGAFEHFYQDNAVVAQDDIQDIPHPIMAA